MHACEGESGDEQFCAIHLINEGETVDGRTASIFFRGTDAVDSYLCKLSSLDSSNIANPSPCKCMCIIIIMCKHRNALHCSMHPVLSVICSLLILTVLDPLHIHISPCI